MTYPGYPPQQPQPQQWAQQPYMPPPPKPTVPAKFGKIGFWLLIGSIAVTIISSVVSMMYLSSIASSWSSVDDPVWVISASVAVGVIAWVARIAATVFGIVGLVRRERPMWWSIVAVCTIPIVWIFSITMFFVTMIFMAAVSSF